MVKNKRKKNNDKIKGKNVERNIYFDPDQHDCVKL